jgi:hypothetical protein
MLRRQYGRIDWDEAVDFAFASIELDERTCGIVVSVLEELVEQSNPDSKAGRAFWMAARSSGTSLLRAGVSWRVTFAILPSLPAMPATA